MKKLMIIPLVFLLCFTFSCQKAEEVAEEPTLAQRLPIIDVHFHAGSSVNEANIPDWFPKNVSFPKTNEELIQETFEMLDRYNIVKVVAFGNILEHWNEKAPERIIPGVPIFMSEKTSKPEFLSNLHKAFTEGHFEVLGEFWIQPAGLEPSDPSVKPYFDMAEEFDVPIGIHMGPGYKESWPQYQVSLGNPLLLEGTLALHPELRLYVMHAGYPFADEMIGLMLAYPQVCVDISFINWGIPRAAFHSYLKRLIEAGLEKRIMFGSDYFWSPDILRLAVEGVESADFLTEEQKRDIFYNNAFRFLRLDESSISKQIQSLSSSKWQQSDKRKEDYMKKLYMILPLALILCLIVGCQDKAAKAELEAFKAQAALEEQNKALIRECFEDWNKGSSEAFMEKTTPDYAYYSPSGNPNPMSREEAVENVKVFWKGFPDLNISIEEIIAKGDRLTTRFIIRGTHEGEFMGIPATGKKIELSAIIISRVENGKFVEEWEEMDIMGLMMQLGMELKPKEGEK